MPKPRVTSVTDVAQLEAALGARPVDGRAIALIGGADLLGDEDAADIGRFLGAVAAAAERAGVSVVDGGTDSGVMRLIGASRREADASFRLIGVVPGRTLGRSSRDGTPIRIAADHPEIVLVPGERFGDETEWLFRVADFLGSDAAPTVVVNGGRLSFDEAVGRLREGRTVYAVSGSGRAADVLAGGAPTDTIGPLPDDLRNNPALRVIPSTADATHIERLIASRDQGEKE